MDKLKSVSFDDLDAIEIGAAILGTGGGGNPYIGKLRCREELKKGNKIDALFSKCHPFFSKCMSYSFKKLFSTLLKIISF